MENQFGVIGDPLSQSPSPALFSKAFEYLNLPYEYKPYPVISKDLKSWFQTTSLQGFNVTIPHKQTIIPLLNTLTNEAKSIGAVNTVYKKNDLWIGHNTDALGFMQSFDFHVEKNWQSKPILILGAGGASRAVGYSLLYHKAERVFVTNRNINHAHDLVSYWKSCFPNAQFKIIEWSALSSTSDLNTVGVVINTTPLGLKSQNPWPDLKFIHSLSESCLVYDVVANPIMTEFLFEAEKRHLKIVSGYEMLLNQAVLAFEIFTGHSAPREVMKNALLNFLKHETF